MTFQELLDDERMDERMQIAERFLKSGASIEMVKAGTQLTDDSIQKILENLKQKDSQQ